MERRKRVLGAELELELELGVHWLCILRYEPFLHDYEIMYRYKYTASEFRVTKGISPSGIGVLVLIKAHTGFSLLTSSSAPCHRALFLYRYSATVVCYHFGSYIPRRTWCRTSPYSSLTVELPASYGRLFPPPLPLPHHSILLHRRGRYTLQL